MGLALSLWAPRAPRSRRQRRVASSVRRGSRHVKHRQLLKPPHPVFPAGSRQLRLCRTQGPTPPGPRKLRLWLRPLVAGQGTCPERSSPVPSCRGRVRAAGDASPTDCTVPHAPGSPDVRALR